jgi:hypothetical protein
LHRKECNLELKEWPQKAQKAQKGKFTAARRSYWGVKLRSQLGPIISKNPTKTAKKRRTHLGGNNNLVNQSTMSKTAITVADSI